MCPILQCEMEGLKLTPLHVACEYGHEEIARILIEMGGANLEAENKKRQTLLHKGQSACDIRTLGARVDFKSKCRDKGCVNSFMKCGKGERVCKSNGRHMSIAPRPLRWTA